MATLYVMRHAKSRWDEDVEDFYRGLLPRRASDAPLMGRHLRERGVGVDVVLSSPATRAFETANAVASELGCENVVTDTRLYEHPMRSVIEAVREHGRAAQSMLMVGHNPTLWQCVEQWTGARLEAFPTSAVACVQLPGVDVATLQESGNTLLWVARVKSLR